MTADELTTLGARLASYMLNASVEFYELSMYLGALAPERETTLYDAPYLIADVCDTSVETHAKHAIQQIDTDALIVLKTIHAELYRMIENATRK